MHYNLVDVLGEDGQLLTLSLTFEGIGVHEPLQPLLQRRWHKRWNEIWDVSLLLSEERPEPMQRRGQGLLISNRRGDDLFFPLGTGLRLLDTSPIAHVQAWASRANAFLDALRPENPDESRE